MLNDATSFGLISRLIHWAMAALVIGLLILGTELAHIQPGLANLWLYGLHKTMGLTALGLALLRLIWLASPALPVGGFSYSEGLEAAVEHGHVVGEAQARGWLLDQMHLQQARGEWPLVASAARAWARGDLVAVADAGGDPHHVAGGRPIHEEKLDGATEGFGGHIFGSRRTRNGLPSLASSSTEES